MPMRNAVTVTKSVQVNIKVIRKGQRAVVSYQRNVQSMILPHLSDLMREKKATNISLAKTTGYEVSTISNARRGLPIKVTTATDIIEALETKTFQRDNRGAR